MEEDWQPKHMAVNASANFLVFVPKVIPQNHSLQPLEEFIKRVPHLPEDALNLCPLWGINLFILFSDSVVYVYNEV